MLKTFRESLSSQERLPFHDFRIVILCWTLFFSLTLAIDQDRSGIANLPTIDINQLNSRQYWTVALNQLHQDPSLVFELQAKLNSELNFPNQSQAWKTHILLGALPSKMSQNLYLVQSDDNQQTFGQGDAEIITHNSIEWINVVLESEMMQIELTEENTALFATAFNIPAEHITQAQFKVVINVRYQTWFDFDSGPYCIYMYQFSFSDQPNLIQPQTLARSIDEHQDAVVLFATDKNVAEIANSWEFFSNDTASGKVISLANQQFDFAKPASLAAK